MRGPWAVPLLFAAALGGCVGAVADEARFGDVYAAAEREAVAWRPGAVFRGASADEWPPLDLPGAGFDEDAHVGNGLATAWTLNFEDGAMEGFSPARLTLRADADGTVVRQHEFPGISHDDGVPGPRALRWTVDSDAAMATATANGTFADLVGEMRRPLYSLVLFEDDHPRPLAGPPITDLLGASFWRAGAWDGRLLERCWMDDDTPECRAADENYASALVEATSGTVVHASRTDDAGTAEDAFWHAVMSAPGTVWVDERERGRFSGAGPVTTQVRFGAPLVEVTVEIEVCYGREIPGSRVTVALTTPDGERQEFATEPALGGHRCVEYTSSHGSDSTEAVGGFVLEIGKPADSVAADYEYRIFAGVPEPG